ncbi:MAG TPA: tetratricopeptide repeat protein [Candidatus Eisenbacteria bacterium]|jgi:tetratricopeptide (TPR) repeat protein
MQARSTLLSVFVTALWASLGLASMGGGSKPESPPPANPNLPSSSAANPSGPHQEAEAIYALAYEEIAKAKKDLAGGKTKNAEKKFKRALDRGERAVALDSTYHEAWNLVGYAARKLGNYDKAFAAYDKCLSLDPDYAPAREYLGEAWLERGDAKKAREQLARLEEINPGSTDAQTLRTAIETYEAAHPAAASDSTGASTSGEAVKP